MKQILLIGCILLLNTFVLAQSCKPNFSTTTNSNLGLTVTRTSSFPTTPNSPFYTIYWGDGLSSFSFYGNGSHTYATWGNYSVKLVYTMLDSSNNNSLYCKDSVTKIVSIGGCKPAFSLKKISSFGASLTITSGHPFPNTISNMPHYTVDWGDGTNQTVYQYATHTYATPGNYFVKLVSTVLDSSNNNTLYCKDSLTKMYIQGGCGNANFSNSNNGGLKVNFNNTSSNLSGKTKSYQWAFGDGNTSTVQSPVHIYNTTGTYNVMLITTWRSSSNQVYCIDTIQKSINVSTTTSSNKIHGHIHRADSLVLPLNPTYKVWLIKYNSSSQILSAVDSVTVQTTNNFNHTFYQFSSVAPGLYRVKAAITNGPTTGTGYVPTYCLSSLMWNNADSFLHYGGNTVQGINMKQGTRTSGPGFVGGNVLQGANKGTANGIEGLNVFVLNSNGDPIAFDVTDANGDYSFIDLPDGTYTIHPEQLNFATTPASVIINASKVKYSGVNFERSLSNRTIVPKTTSITDVNNDKLSFVLTPNPAQNKVVILWGDSNNEIADVMITDVSGKQVFSTQARMNGQSVIEFGDLQTGFYLLNVSSEVGSSTHKLLIQH